MLQEHVFLIAVPLRGAQSEVDIGFSNSKSIFNAFLFPSFTVYSVVCHQSSSSGPAESLVARSNSSHSIGIDCGCNKDQQSATIHAFFLASSYSGNRPPGFTSSK